MGSLQNGGTERAQAMETKSCTKPTFRLKKNKKYQKDRRRCTTSGESERGLKKKQLEGTSKDFHGDESRGAQNRRFGPKIKKKTAWEGNKVQTEKR